MELKLLEPFDIGKLLNIEDDIEEYIIEDRASWIQFLSQRTSVENSNITVLAVMDEEDSIKAYTVIVDNRFPPFADSAVIIYAWSGLGHIENKKYFDEIKNWLEDQGYSEIETYTRQPEKMKNFGFEETGFVKMRLTLG